MSTIITRLYSSEETAKAVEARLKEEEYQAPDITIITKDDDSDMDALKQTIRRAGVYPKAAATYAEHVAGGAVLLVLRARVGKALKGTAIVDEAESIDAGVKYKDVYVGTGGPATHLMRKPNLPNLLPDGQKVFTNDGLVKSGTPFSSMFGIPLLTSGPTGKARLITKTSTFFSSFFGMSMLMRNSGRAQLITENTTPFSSALGLPLLSSRRR